MAATATSFRSTGTLSTPRWLARRGAKPTATARPASHTIPATSSTGLATPAWARASPGTSRPWGLTTAARRPDTNVVTSFVWDSTTGEPGPPLSYSGWTNITAEGINGFGQVVGQYTDPSGNQLGFVEDSGAYTALNLCKRGVYEDVLSINNNEQVLVECGSTSPTTEFMYDLTTGTEATVYDPSTPGNVVGGCNSCAANINDAAQVVGVVYQSLQSVPAFIATPMPQ